MDWAFFGLEEISFFKPKQFTPLVFKVTYPTRIPLTRQNIYLIFFNTYLGISLSLSLNYLFFCSKLWYENNVNGVNFTGCDIYLKGIMHRILLNKFFSSHIEVFSSPIELSFLHQ